MYHVGEEVYVLDEGLQDVQSGGLEYVRNNRIATVRFVVQVPEQIDMVVVEFSDMFPGGHHCNYKASNGRGQYFMANHLRPAYVNTVPNIGRQHEKDRPGEDEKGACSQTDATC